MKKLLFLVGLTVSLVTMQAETVTGSNLTAGHSRAVVATPCVLQSISLWTTNRTPTIVRLFDGDVVYTNAAFTNITTYVTNITTTYTNSVGTTNSFTDTTVYSAATVTAANTNNPSTSVVAIIVPASGTDNVAGQAITYNVPISIGRYLTISNNLTGVSYLLNYRKP